MANAVNFGSAFVAINQAGFVPRFELAFNQLQNTVIRRLNGEIAKIDDADDSPRIFEKLKKERDSLIASVPALEKYHFINQGNAARLSELNPLVGDAILKYGTEDASDNLTAGEAADINTRLTEIIDRIGNMVVIEHLEIIDGKLIQRLKDEIAALSDISAVAGVVDPVGTTTPTNRNRELFTLLGNVFTLVAAAETVTLDMALLANGLLIDVQAEVFDIDAKMADLTVLGAQKKLDEIDALKEKYSLFLKVMSIAFEGNFGFTQLTALNLTPQRPPPGSVLNLFS